MKNSNFKKEKIWLLDEKYNGQKCEAFLTDLKKLKKGYPLAYLIGNQPFLNCVIDLAYKPLIPRPETEFWANDFIEKQKKRHLVSPNASIQILDIFSGSGCIGLGVLKNLQNSKVDFAELDENYIKQIQKNLILNKISKDRYNIFQSDVFNNIPLKKYNAILANPPYIPKSKISQVQNSVLEYENHNTLFADSDGLFFIKKLIFESPKYLKKDGQLWIEFDASQKEEIEQILKTKKIKKYKFWKDQFKKYRVLIMTI